MEQEPEQRQAASRAPTRAQPRAPARGGARGLQRRRPGCEPGGGGAHAGRRHRHALPAFPDARGAVPGGLSPRGRPARRSGRHARRRCRPVEALRRWLHANVAWSRPRRAWSRRSTPPPDPTGTLYADNAARLARSADGLLARPSAEGRVRADLGGEDVMRAVVGMCYAREHPELARDRPPPRRRLRRWPRRPMKRAAGTPRGDFRLTSRRPPRKPGQPHTGTPSGGSHVRKTLTFGALAALVLATLAGGASAQTKLNWAHVYEVTEPFHTEFVWAAEEIKKRTDGRYEIAGLPGLAARQGSRHQPGPDARHRRHHHLRAPASRPASTRRSASPTIPTSSAIRTT